jgi:hypothetical protein
MTNMTSLPIGASQTPLHQHSTGLPVRPPPLKSLPEIAFSVKHAAKLLFELHQHHESFATYCWFDQLESGS